jgi:hypothetical protein
VFRRYHKFQAIEFAQPSISLSRAEENLSIVGEHEWGGAQVGRRWEMEPEGEGQKG